MVGALCFEVTSPFLVHENLLELMASSKKKEDFREIIRNNVKQCELKLSLAQRWKFQQDNDLKHTALIVRKFFKGNNINVLEYLAKCPDLNLIANL